MGSLINVMWTCNQLLFHRKKLHMLRQMRKNENLSRDEFANQVWRNQKRILTHAFENVPFYKKLYTAAGIHPEDIKDPEDFTHIPTITKEMIRENLEQMVESEIDRSRLRESRTGGSTGDPLMVYHDANNRETLSATQARLFRWWGLRPTARVIRVWRVQDPTKTIVRHPNKVGLKRVFSLRPVTFNAITMNERTMGEYASCLNEMRPDVLMGYLGALDALAEYIEEKQFKLRDRLRAVWSTSSPLGIHQEERMQRVYGAPVYDQYGSCEIHYLAAECRAKEGLHMLEDIRHIEFVDEQGRDLTEPNVTGDTVVTDLINYAAPLIRYRNGDRGSYRRGECSCGNVLPLMNRVTGRVTDMILLSDGTKIAGSYFTTIFDPYVEEVKRFQVHQKTKNLICIKMVMTKPEMFDTLRKKLTENFKIFTKDLVEFRFERMDHIEHDQGKYRYVISDVKY